jgi:hypothetical protein
MGGIFGAWDGNDEAGVRVRGRAMREGVYINGVSGAAPGLDLLSHLLGVRGGENTGEAGIAEEVGQRVQEVRDSIRKADRGKYTSAQERVAA